MTHPKCYMNCSSAEELSQGDVLQFRGSVAVAPSHRIGLVVTADCDIAHGKNRNSIAYLPVLSSREYGEQLAGPKRLADLLKRHVDNFLADFSAHLPAGMSGVELRDWYSNLSPEDAWSACRVDSLNNRERFLRRFSAISIASALPPGAKLTDIASAISGLKSLDGGKHTDGRVDLEKTVRDDALPSDVFYLPEVSDGHSGGYFVYLRSIMSVTQDSLSLTASGWDASVVARRISRLDPFVRFALLQSLSSLFARVGVHDSFRDRSGARLWVDHEID